MQINKFVMGGVAVALVAVFVIAANWYRSEEATQAEQTASQGSDRLVRPHSPTLGPADAPVTLVEFLDPECEACGAMHPIVKQLMGEFDGRVRLVVRYMPFHQNSAYAASLLEGAREQNKYWELMDVIFARQPEWAAHDAPRPDLLATYARNLGLDMTRLGVTGTSAETERRIRQDAEDGQALGVTRTPTFFVNGTPLPQIGYEPVRAAIAAALK
ncbi:MAG: DsbA family protein [Vicinamibacterales bacterium]